MASESGELRKSLDVDEAVKRAMRLAQFSLERAADAVFWMGPDARFIYANETACRVLGYSREELLSMTVHDIDPKFPPEVWRTYWEDLKRQGSCVLESWHHTKDGRIIPVEIAANYLEFDGKEYNCAFARDITERKQTEKALFESEELFRDFFEKAPIGFHIFGPDRIIADINEAELTMIGYEREEIVGRKTWADLIVAEQRDQFEKHWQDIITKGEVSDLEYTVVHKNGHHVDVLLNASSRFDEYGKLINTRGSVVNITERARAEQALRESEERYRTLVENIDLGITLVDAEHNISMTNSAIGQLFGRPVSEFVGEKCYDRFEESGEACRDCPGEKAMKTGEPEEVEVQGVRAGGSRFPIRVRAFPMFDENKKATGFIEVIEDITERKQVELALRMSEQRFRAIADYTYDWENWMSPKGRLLWVNPAVERLTGYNMEECMKMPDFPMSVVYEQDRQEAAKTFEEARRENSGKNFEFRIRRKDGDVVWVAMSWQPIYDNKGSCQGHRSSIRDITERKYAEIALRESRQMLQLVLDTIPARVFWKDRNSVHLGCNQRFAGDAGLNSPEQIIGTNDFDLSWKEQAESYRSDDRQVIESEVPKLNYEEPFRSPDGQLHWIRTSKIPLRDTDGNVIGVMGTYEDISEHKQAERELQASEQRYRDLVETMNEGLGVADENYMFTYVNRKFTDMLGYSQGEMVGHHLTDFLDEENKKIMDEQITKRRRGEAETFDLVWTAKDGRKVYTIASPKGIFDSEGNFKGSFGVLTDITARKQTEEQILKLAKFPDENPNPVVRISVEGVVLYGNKRSGELLKAWESSINDCIPNEWYQIVLDSLATRQPKQAETECEDRILSLTFAPVTDFNYVNVYAHDITDRKRGEEEILKLAKFPDENPNPVLRVSADGAILYANRGSSAMLNACESGISDCMPREWFEDTLASRKPKQFEVQCGDQIFCCTFAPVVDFNYVNVYALDITERKLAEMALDRLNRELDAKNQELESILYVASHDLRSPLVNILGFSHELSRSSKLLHSALAAKRDVLADMGKEVQVAFDERVPEALGFISASAKKMDSLLSGLLRLCRLGYAAMNIERVDMNAMMSSITASMEYQIKESGATVEVEALPPCVGDAERLNQVFSNLLDNAVKYLDDSRRGLIRIYGRTEQGRNIYCVEDNGIGIAPEHQGKIFEVFHRLEPDEHAGEGLGLSIVRRILNRHNGEVWVESAPGEGSKFFMSLPGS